MAPVICGIDEAGRGCLAGPVVSAAIIIDKNKIPAGVTDSKRLSPAKRSQYFSILSRDAISYSVGIASNVEIDNINILKASMLSMERAFFSLPVRPDAVFIDGPFAPQGLSGISGLRVIPVIKGDEKVKLVSCASIIAKVFRDTLMSVLDEKYPLYGFKKHKGYGTAAHKEIIAAHGISDIHRKTFRF